jgi:septation ring formation regulator EzrA
MSIACRKRMTTSIDVRDGIGQVREILVGAIQRDLERRIAKLETNSGVRLGELQQEVRRRIDVIEAHLRKEIDALSARLDGEVVELKDGLRALTREDRETSSASDQRVAKLEETVAHAQQELRSQILEQAKSFLDELHQMREEVADTLERELGSLEPEGAGEPIPREHREAGENAPAT